MIESGSPAEETQSERTSRGAGVPVWVFPLAGVLLVLVWFLAVEERYSGDRGQSVVSWLLSAWNEENDFEHGPLFPLIIGGLIWYRWKDIRASMGEGSAWGLAVVAVGALMYLVGYRTLQPRVAIASLPVLLWGSSLFLWGWQAARWLFLPVFFFWLAIPVPAFQQATNFMQILATKMAHLDSGLFGVETIVEGNEISSVDGKWEPLEIAKGCSGIRSLMALLMISGAWACLAKMALWKRGILFLSAIPLAILGNALRVTSVFVIAEYGDSDWARNTWHDWSGLVLFYPISLACLFGIHSLLEGGMPWKKAKRRAVRRVIVKDTSEENPFTPVS